MISTVSQKKPPLPVDHGWAWLVMLGIFVNISLPMILVRATGLIILEFLDLYQESATVTTTSFGLSAVTFAVFSFLGPTVFMRRFEVRTMVLTGTSLNSLCILAMAFAPNIIFINFIFLFFGLSHGLVFVPQMTLVGFYFKRWLAFATSFVSLGLSISTMGAVPLTQYLLDTYALQGALLILSAINMNCVAASLLLRPVSMYSVSSNTRAGERSGKPYVDDDIKHIQEVTELTSCGNTEELHNQGDLSPTISTETDLIGYQSTDIENKARVQGQSLLQDDVVHCPNQTASISKSENGFRNDIPNANFLNGFNDEHGNVNRNNSHELNLGHNHEMKSDENIVGETLVLDSESTDVMTFNTETQQHTEIGDDNFMPEKNIEAISFFARFKKSISRSIYTHPVGILLVLAAGIGVHTSTIIAYMPAIAREKGLSSEHIPFLVTIIGACDMITKFVIGIVADLHILKPMHLACLGELVTGLVIQFIRSYHGLGLMVTLQVLIGLSVGIMHVMLPVITVEALGPNHLGHILSGYIMINGLINTLDHVMSGVFKDVSGSFVGLYNFMGSMNMVCSVLLILLPLFARLPRARNFKL